MANAKFLRNRKKKKIQSPEYILVPGTGKITINKRDIDEYLGLETLKAVRSPAARAATEYHR